MNNKEYHKKYYEKNKHKWIVYRQNQLSDPIKKKALRHSQKMYARRNYKPVIKKNKKKKEAIEIIDTFISFENYIKYLNL